MHTLTAQRAYTASHALCQDCLTFTAAPSHQSSQPGIPPVQAPSVLSSQSTMHQPNIFTPSLKPPPVFHAFAMMLVSKSAHGNAHIRGEAQQRIGHTLAQQSARKKVPQSVAQWLLPFSHTVTPPSSSRLRTPAVLDLQPCAEGLSTKYENLLNK